ncbi:hypothetical protein GUJ93_ZPchr0013g36897 [Zizania palustris]|uniref:Uncharacterized protein n=1 Tax=Zizania palustris TaxID=103762 RepID=A0A8J6BYT9_ZIZPA|nr:hypothetical protein GUJ93_ZPchr0013g36897 [Zizania palustris]
MPLGPTATRGDHRSGVAPRSGHPAVRRPQAQSPAPPAVRPPPTEDRPPTPTPERISAAAARHLCPRGPARPVASAPVPPPGRSSGCPSRPRPSETLRGLYPVERISIASKICAEVCFHKIPYEVVESLDLLWSEVL